VFGLLVWVTNIIGGENRVLMFSRLYTKIHEGELNISQERNFLDMKSDSLSFRNRLEDPIWSKVGKVATSQTEL